MARCSAAPGSPDYWRSRGYYLRASQEYAQQGDRQSSARCKEYGALAEGMAQVEAEKARLNEAARAAAEAPPAPAQKTPQEQAKEHYAAALTAFQSADMQMALAEAEAAKRLDSKLPEVRYLLGVLYEARGRWDEARQELYAFVTLSPTSSLSSQAVALLNRLSGLQMLFSDDFEQGTQRWASTRTGAEPTLGATPRGDHYLSVLAGADVYTRFPTLSRGAVELYVWLNSPKASGSVDLDVVLVDETAGARVGTISGPSALRITVSGGGLYVNGAKCLATVPPQGWHRLGVGLDGANAVVSLDGTALTTVAYCFAVTGLELTGRGLTTGASPACIDNVRIMAAAAALSAPPA